MEKKRTGFYIEQGFLKELNVLCVKHNVTLNDIAEEAVKRSVKLNREELITPRQKTRVSFCLSPEESTALRLRKLSIGVRSASDLFYTALRRIADELAAAEPEIKENKLVSMGLKIDVNLCRDFDLYAVRSGSNLIPMRLKAIETALAMDESEFANVNPGKKKRTVFYMKEAVRTDLKIKARRLGIDTGVMVMAAMKKIIGG